MGMGQFNNEQGKNIKQEFSAPSTLPGKNSEINKINFVISVLIDISDKCATIIVFSEILLEIYQQLR